MSCLLELQVLSPENYSFEINLFAEESIINSGMKTGYLCVTDSFLLLRRGSCYPLYWFATPPFLQIFPF